MTCPSPWPAFVAGCLGGIGLGVLLSIAALLYLGRRESRHRLGP